MWAFGDEPIGGSRSRVEGTCVLLLCFWGCWRLRAARYCGVFAEPSSLERQLEFARRRQVGDVGIAALDLKTGEASASTAIRPSRWPARSRSRSPRLSGQVDHGRRSLDDLICGQSGPPPDGADDDPQRQSRDGHPLADLGGPGGFRTGSSTTGSTGCGSTAPSPGCWRPAAICGTAAIPSTPQAMVDLLGAHRQGASDQAREPQLPAGPDGPVRDRQEPHGALLPAARRSRIRPGRSPA